ncbi:acyl carrier protein [Nitrosomonas sp. JL21]|uniref:acyl carrier protein n=1 Tax=Nitrosomonas sp. JL21 TaxID=153949 RepID=UPI0013711A66|nr:acyl carrier protein [Nitrosomonas sp. JL21]MBL8498106.1 acyl carrier protein [Nitrosomonas sp.]MXS76380.1 acyl carrier protein [Nitrosomonas sp. JL21]
MTAHISPSAIAENICFFIRNHLVIGSVEVTPATPLARLGLDSFSLIEIILFVERQYQLQLSDEALTQENICSSETLANYIHQHLL